MSYGKIKAPLDEFYVAASHDKVRKYINNYMFIVCVETFTYLKSSIQVP